MEQRPWRGDVERARSGDLQAFTRLVTAFQDAAVGTAFRWLGDLEAARDVAQEAFSDAHLQLHHLREADAFPGWLRRVVIKHCDRITRRSTVRTSPLGGAGAVASAEPNPESALAERELAHGLRLAIESLPDEERLPLALHYFAGEPQPEIAAFLELPLSTVKKRLRTARARLRESRKELMSETLESVRPSSTKAFSNNVEFFLAVRAGDRRRVEQLLDLDPSLIEAEQSWDPALVRDGVLPFARRATGLITAVERGDDALVGLLLQRGAHPDGACGCPTGESALWAAVLLDRLALARRLLAAGADPDFVAGTGNRPLHLAAMRGAAELAELLIASGADPAATDRTGRTPADWAELCGHAALAARLRTGRPTSGVLAPGPENSSAPVGIVETGIKAIDLFAPLVPGALVRVPFSVGSGMVVLLNELTGNFVSSPARAALWTGFAQRPFDTTDLAAEVAEAGLHARVEIHIGSLDDPPERRRAVFERGLARAESLVTGGGRDVMVVLLEENGYEAFVDASLARLARPREHAITTLLVTPMADAKREPWSDLRAPFDAQIALTRRHVRAGLFPAIDPITTRSRALDPDRVGARHVALAARARQLFERYAGEDPELQLRAPETYADPVAARTAQRLHRYLTQPFFTTQPFTGRPGLRASVEEMLGAVERILDGEHVEADAGEF